MQFHPAHQICNNGFPLIPCWKCWQRTVFKMHSCGNPQPSLNLGGHDISQNNNVCRSHVSMKIIGGDWVFRCVSEYFGAWIFRCVNNSVCEYFGVWISRRVNISVCEYFGVWIFLCVCVNIPACEYLPRWIFLWICVWIFLWICLWICLWIFGPWKMCECFVNIYVKKHVNICVNSFQAASQIHSHKKSTLGNPRWWF